MHPRELVRIGIGIGIGIGIVELVALFCVVDIV
jgi:hypothetical protein